MRADDLRDPECRKLTTPERAAVRTIPTSLSLAGPAPATDCLTRLQGETHSPETAPEPHLAKAQTEYLLEYARIHERKRRASPAPAVAVPKPMVLRLLWRLARKWR